MQFGHGGQFHSRSGLAFRCASFLSPPIPATAYALNVGGPAFGDTKKNRMRHIKVIFFCLTITHAVGQQIDSVKSGGYTIYYQLQGVGRPIYLLSGGPGITPEGMESISNELSKKYQVILVHQRGTGRTKVNVDEQSIQIDKYCLDIKAIKEKLKHEKITLLGHSWGGMLSMHYATNYTSDIDRLILVGSGGYNLKFNDYFAGNIFSKLSEDDQNSVQVLNSLFEQILSMQSDNTAKIQTTLLLEYVNINVKGYLYDKKNFDKIKLSNKDFDSRIFVLMMSSLAKANWDLREKLEKLKIKTLILQGRQDPIDLETARMSNTAIKESELVIIEQSGHFPWIEKPDDFFKIVNNFLEKK